MGMGGGVWVGVQIIASDLVLSMQRRTLQSTIKEMKKNIGYTTGRVSNGCIDTISYFQFYTDSQKSWSILKLELYSRICFNSSWPGLLQKFKYLIRL